MKTFTKRNLRVFLFTCLGLIVATVTCVGGMRIPEPPGRPGRPSAFDIEADRCKLRFKKPLVDGGATIIRYRIEYKSDETQKWLLERTIVPQYPMDDTMQSEVDNRVGLFPVVFRTMAANKFGISEPSVVSDPITFRNPF